MSELKKEVEMFNLIAGEHPMGEYSEDKVLIARQIDRQAGLVAEEGKEVGEALSLKNILKECVDVWYTNTYLETLLEACGVDVKGAKKAVIENNNTKYTKEQTEANKSQVHHSMNGIPCYVDSTLVDGEVFYTVKRVPDGKVLKPISYEPVNLNEFIPEEWR